MPYGLDMVTPVGRAGRYGLFEVVGFQLWSIVLLNDTYSASLGEARNLNEKPGVSFRSAL